MMDVVLKRSINVESYEALMDVGRFKDEYKFLLPVLALSEEGGITDDLVNTRLFDVNEHDPRGRRLLEVMEGYRLIERRGHNELIIDTQSQPAGYRFTGKGMKVREFLLSGQYDKFDEDLLEKLSALGIIQRAYYGYEWGDPGYSPDLLGNEIFQTNDRNLPKLAPHLASELEKLGILEPQQNRSTSSAYYELTETGRRALQEGQVPVPEKGVYVLTGTTDPLFVEPVIACRPKEGGREIEQEFDRIAQSSWNKGKSQGMGKKQEKNTSVWLDELRRATPRVLTLAAQDHKLIQIVGIDENINQVQPKDRISINLRLSLRSTPEIAVIRTDGKKERKTIVKTAFNLTLMDVMKCLFREKQYDFVECGNAPALLVAYEEVKGNPSEINRMQRTTTVHAPEIQGFGRFDDVKVNDLPLLPRTLEDAGNWARDRVIDGITSYIDETSYVQLCDEKAAGFSERFAPDQVKSRLPTYQEMRAIVKERREADPKRYWFVTTPALLTFREGM